jgi:uncharacterized protein YlaI
MKVQCVMCDKIEDIDKASLVAKRLRNRPLTTYMCSYCALRIQERTKQRYIDGRIKKPTFHINNDGWG